MDLNFYSDLTEGGVTPGDPEFLDSQVFNGFDSVQKFPGGGENYLAISGGGHPFLSSSEVPLHSSYSLQIQDSETFHTPSLGDEEFEIPPISLDPDSLGVSDVVSHFGELGDGGPAPVVPGNAVVQGDDPSFASTFVTRGSQGQDHLSLMTQQGGGPMLTSTLGMDLGHPIGSQFGSSSPMTIDVPLSHMAHNQLTTIDQSELSAQLGLSLGGGAMLAPPHSPEQPLSAAGSPLESLQDDDMDDFRRKSVLVESPVSLSVISLSPSLSEQPAAAAPPTAARRGVASGGGAGGGAGPKKGKKKKDPNEPQKPVSAYALFFRDTQAAIKGQNPNATFGEVSKIVASMWDSLGEEQKQVYKRKTEAAKKEYLKALAAYRASQLSQPTTIEVLDTPPSPPAAPVMAAAPVTPPPQVLPPASAPSPNAARSNRGVPQHAPDNNTITNICMSNIIIDLPQVSTRSRTGAHKPPPPAPPTVTKIVIAKPAPRQPPPLQQMQNTPPPPRLQQMVHSVAPPPLLAKPRGGGGAHPSAAPMATPPPPLQIKIVPARVDVVAAPLAEAPPPPRPEADASRPSETEEMEVELNSSPVREAAPPAGAAVCVRAGCNNPPVESKDWDREYCSNECVDTHCRDVFMAWCVIRGQNSTTVT